MTRIVKNDLADNDMPKLDMFKNCNRIRIFKCCMSCEHKNINSKGERICEKTKKVVDKYDICGKWFLARGFERAGAGDGNVDIHCRDKFIARRMAELERLGYIKSDEKYKQETSYNQ